MIWFLSAFAVIWLCGWVLMYFNTSVYQEPTLWGKIKGAVTLFFVWPIIAMAMANQGDV